MTQTVEISDFYDTDVFGLIRAIRGNVDQFGGDGRASRAARKDCDEESGECGSRRVRMGAVGVGSGGRGSGKGGGRKGATRPFVARCKVLLASGWIEGSGGGISSISMVCMPRGSRG